MEFNTLLRKRHNVYGFPSKEVPDDVLESYEIIIHKKAIKNGGKRFEEMVHKEKW